MKVFQIKFPVILVIIFLITGIGLSNCGQQTEDKTTTNTMDTSNHEVIINDTVANTTAGIDQPVNTQQEVITANSKKETELVKKPGAVQPPVTEKKPVPVTTTPPPGNTTVTPPKPAPVVIVPEPVKPASETKPVPVVTPTPIQNNWPVPANYKSMKSPFAADKESLELGKSLYGTHCKSCHGSKGDGKGTKAATLDTEIRSFMSAGFRSQLPGEVYYKTIIGRKDMPKFDKKIPDEEERWAVVNYIRSL